MDEENDEVAHPTKRCAKCRIEKPFSGFFKQKEGRFGLHAHCRDCQNAAARERYWARKNGEQFPRPRRPVYGPPPPTKACTNCGIDKPLDAYGRQTGGRYGLHPRCKECRQAAERGRYLEKRDEILDKQRNDPRRREYQKWSERKKRYGITREIYEAMYEAQDGRCAVCNQWAEVLCIDHDHETGEVRGLLCSPCNVGLGHLRDDPARLLAAVEYLRNPPGVPS